MNSIRYVLITVILAISLVAPAAAADVVGQVSPDPATTACLPGNFNRVQGGISAGVPSYTVASNGVITSWSTRANAVASRSMGLRVYRPNGGGGNFTFVGGSTDPSVQPLTVSSVNTFNTRVSVQAGDVLGLRFTDNTACATEGTVDDLTYSGGGEVSIGNPLTFSGSSTGYRLNISATVEADADGDGYGDETQDLCPTDAGIQGTCPTAPSPPASSDTTPPSFVVKAGRATTRRSSIAVSVTSNEAGTAVVSGKLEYPNSAGNTRLKSKSVQLTANSAKKVTLAISRRARAKAARYLRRNLRTTVALTVVVTDSAGNASTVRTSVQVRRA